MTRSGSRSRDVHDARSEPATAVPLRSTAHRHREVRRVWWRNRRSARRARTAARNERVTLLRLRAPPRARQRGLPGHRPPADGRGRRRADRAPPAARAERGRALQIVLAEIRDRDRGAAPEAARPTSPALEAELAPRARSRSGSRRPSRSRTTSPSWSSELKQALGADRASRGADHRRRSGRRTSSSRS